MPFLEADWIIPDREGIPREFPRQTWLPETRAAEWWHRGRMPTGEPWELASLWRGSRTLVPYAADLLADLDEQGLRSMVHVLGGDIGSLQRDSFLLWNYAERLKSSPTDSKADQIVSEMQSLGLTSGTLPWDVGGPPPHESPRPHRKVLNWMFKQLARSGEKLAAISSVAATIAPRLGISAIAIDVSMAPGVSLEFSVEKLQMNDRLIAQTLSGAIFDEMSADAF